MSGAMSYRRSPAVAHPASKAAVAHAAVMPGAAHAVTYTGSSETIPQHQGASI